MKPILNILLLLLFSACEKSENLPVVWSEKDSQLEIHNGVLYHQNSKFTGVLKSFDAINLTNNTARYLYGRKEGEERKVYQNNELAEVRFYRSGVKIGTHKSWRTNRQQKFEYPYNNSGVYHGTVKEWYPDGQLLKEFHYFEGKEVGTQKMWAANGNIKANYTVVNGERFGLIGLKKCYSVTTKDEY